ncbi:uncharacterized protein LOC5576422 isoform X2 [Aedes aegypti]|uniref:Uncharacterized protein n=1 Tax=Aedes aegypti TaxID=7159 RepID=A0A6I8U6S3_AEDAE|nr:uncharacterized protein LOC5576422 isoform X2 [Aedes aegypti]
MVPSTKIGQKCIIFGCKNRSGVHQGNEVSFFPVACRGNQVYHRWAKLMPLSGDRHERICSQHFAANDFIENTRQKLKNGAVPTVKLQDGKIQRRKGCCVPKCNPNRTKRGLHHFPMQKYVRQKWKEALGMDEAQDPAGLLICNRHFLTSDFVKVTSRYLKATAVPSRKLVRLINLPRRMLVHLDSHLEDHNYSVYAGKPQSNRIGFVEGCRSKPEGNVKLHKFPVSRDPKYKKENRISKCSKLPTRNSTVSSLHFRKTDSIKASTLCRACGQNLPDDPALSDSFQNYAHMYLAFTNLQLHPRENPEELRICPDCKNKLHEFEQLRETFINVHWRLLEVKPELRDNHEGFDSNAVVEKNPSINEAIVSDINSLEQDVSQNDLYNQTTEQLESIVKVEPVDYCSEDNADDRNEQKAFGYSFQITKESSSDSELSTSSTSDDQSEMLPPTMKKKKKSLEELYPYDKSQRNKFYIPRKRKKFPRQFDCRCPKKCSTLFESEQVLEHFFHKFWASVDKTRQRKMVLEYVRAMPVRRIRCRPQRVRPERAVMFQYFVPTEDCDVRVCQRFFLGILQTTSQTVYRYIYGKTGDRDSAQDEIIIP